MSTTKTEVTKGEVLSQAHHHLTRQIQDSGITKATIALMRLFETTYANATGPEVVITDFTETGLAVEEVGA